MGDDETNWAGLTYPAMLRDRIRRAEAQWDMRYAINRRELRQMKAAYWFWWRWAPVPAVVIGVVVGVPVGNLIGNLLIGGLS